MADDYSKLAVTMRIGKEGFTPTLVKELRAQLHVKKIVKVKFLASSLEGKDKKEEMHRLARLCGGRVLKAVGFVLVLGK